MRRTLALALALAALAACGGGSNDPKSPCERACERIAAASCASSDPQSVCLADCDAMVASEPAACQDEMNAAIACMANGAWTCDANGYAEPVATCDSESAAWDACSGGPVPPPAPPCELACERIAAANCPGDGPQDACVADCNAGVASTPAACQDEMNAAIACIAGDAWTCDANAHAEPVATCDSEVASLSTCLGGPVPPPAPPCELACEKATAANCPSDGPQDACVADCNAGVASTPAACQDEINAAIACMASGAWACDANGNAQPVATCDSEIAAWGACMGGTASIPSGTY